MSWNLQGNLILVSIIYWEFINSKYKPTNLLSGGGVF